MSSPRKRNQDVTNEKPTIFNVLLLEVKSDKSYDLDVRHMAQDLNEYWKQKGASDHGPVKYRSASAIATYCHTTVPHDLTEFLDACEAAVKPGPNATKSIEPIVWKSIAAAVKAAETLVLVELVVSNPEATDLDPQTCAPLWVLVRETRAQLAGILARLGWAINDPSIQTALNAAIEKRQRRR